MKTRALWVLAACALAGGPYLAWPPAAASGDPPLIEARIGELKREIDRNTGDRHRERALELLREMAALDSEHPKVYSAAVRLHLSRREYDEAASLMESFGASDGPGRIYGRGLLHYHRKQKSEAWKALDEALRRYRALGHRAGEAACHILRGILLRNQDPARAAAEQRAALSLLERLDDRLGTASVLNNLGKLELTAGRTAEALALQRRALSIRQQEGDLRGQGISWQQIGMTLMSSGDLPGAIHATEQALAVRRERQDELEQMSSLRQLAKIHAQNLDFERAAERTRESLALARQIGNRDKELRALLELGELELSAGRNRRAIEALDPAVAALERSKDARLPGASSKLGVALLRVGEFSRAGDVLRGALERCGERPALEAAIRNDLTKVALATGALPAALLHQERALELYRAAGDARGELLGENNLGAIYYALGDLATARRHCERALELARASGVDEERARALVSLGVVLADQGESDRALEAFRESIALQGDQPGRRGAAFARFNAAGVLRQLGRGPEALALAQRALAGFRESGDREGETFTLNLLGELERAAGRTDEALATFARALGLSRDHGYRRQEWMAHAGRAAALEAAGRPAEALADYLRAIDLIEGVRAGLQTGEYKMRYLAGKVNLYERAIRLELARADREGDAAGAAAFRLAERARARSLLDLFAESRDAFGAELAPDLARRERGLLDEVGAASVRLVEAAGDAARREAREALDRAEERLERFKVEVRRGAPRYATVVYPEPDALDETRTRALAADEVLLQYFIGDETAIVWQVERDTARVKRLPPPERLAELVAGFLDRAGRAGVASGGRPPGAEQAAALAEALLPFPLPEDKRVLVAPDGPLHHLPFEVLRRGGRYLVEDHALLVIPSATVLRFMRERPAAAAAAGFLGVGDPLARAGDAKFPSLTHSGAALRRIADRFPEDQRVVLAGRDSTLDRLRRERLDRFRYVHFATHGWLDAENPRHSGLRLSPAEGRSGGDFLYLDEIFSMRLASDLVVLAACRSGLGEELRGEGLLGMTRAFLYAGSRAVVVSLWNVNDRSTAEFMEAFYGELAGNRDAADALRRTKLRFLAADRPVQRQPYRWAPFVVVGDPRPAGKKTERSRAESD